MVEGVEEVPSQLEGGSLGDMEVFGQTHVPVINAGLAKPVTRRVAIFTQCRLAEAIEVDPLHYPGQVLMEVATVNAIRAHELAVEYAVDVVGRDAVGKAGLEGGDTSSLPPANQQFRCMIDAGRKLSSVSEGQLVDVAGDETLVD